MSSIYTGKEIDPITGLYYFNARWYDPDLGRFITEDPIKDGSNWYVYCQNNPLTRIDPTGIFSRDPSLPRDEDGRVINVTGQLAEDSKWTEEEIQQGHKDDDTGGGSGGGTNGPTPEEIEAARIQALIDKLESSDFYNEFAGMSAEEQLAFLQETHLLGENQTGRNKGYIAGKLRGLRGAMDLHGLFKKAEVYMNTSLRDFLNLNKKGNTNYDIEKDLKRDRSGWTEMISYGSQLHQATAGEYLHAKFVHDDGREVVIDYQGNIVTDKRDYGTFNYENAHPLGFNSIDLDKYSGGHYKYDMEPYFKWNGKSPGRYNNTSIQMALTPNSESWY